MRPMLTSTINAIAIIIGFFTEEEQKGLAITMNGEEITFLDQLIARWYKATPRYQGKIFRTKAGMLIAANKNMFYRLIEYSKPEFQEKLNMALFDFENLFKVKRTVQEGETSGKTLGYDQGSSKNVNRSANKTRGGSAESGQEFLELDKVWDNEDAAFLEKGLQASKITGVLELSPDRSTLEGTTLKLNNVGAENEKFTEAIQTTSEIALGDQEPTLHTVSTTQMRSKIIQENSHTKVHFSENNASNEATTRVSEYSLADGYNKLFSFKLRDLRELVFQKLDVLFEESCP